MTRALALSAFTPLNSRKVFPTPVRLATKIRVNPDLKPASRYSTRAQTAETSP